MIIIGNKPYNYINLNSIIDTFGDNIRLNLGLPNKNNGTIKSYRYLNVHVYPNLLIHKNLLRYKTTMNDNKYQEILDNIQVNEYKNIKQNNNNTQKYNNYLKNIKCPYIFSKQPTIVCNAIFDTLLKLNTIQTDNLLYVSHTSLNDDDMKKHLYSNIRYAPWHNKQDEYNIIKWLHNNNIIDATLSSLSDHKLPTINCSIIKPSEDIVNRLLKEFGIVILDNYFSINDIETFIYEANMILKNHHNKIEKYEKEELSNDKRIFCVEKVSEYIKTKFSDNSFINSCAKRYNSKINKKTLLNHLIFEESTTKNNGTDWFRDNHNCQFKSIMYLSDVTEKNGNFQFLTNSSKKHIDFPVPRNKSYDTIYSNDTINKIINSKDNVKINDITGQKGTIILVDSTYIHRENIITEGERMTLTQYF